MVLAEDLRQAIIQQAIQGKLTKQLETDGNVDILLKEIKQEKDKFMFENKRKAEPKLAAYDESDIPFEIPANWRWCQLGDIISYQNGYAFKSSDMSKSGNGYPIIKSQNLMTLKVIIKDKNDRIEFPDEKMLLCQIKKNDLLMCLSSQSSNPEPLGKTAIYEFDEPALLNQRVLKMTLMKMDMLYYIFYVINSAYFHYDVSHKGDGSAQSNLKLEHVREMLIPIPPIEEQQRIVDKINEIMTKIDEYEKIEKELEALKKEFPTDMKNALLQAAMQGKLTEQLGSDSSVDELLTSIQIEKKQLIKEKKIYKDKKLVEDVESIFDIDIPYNWRFVNLQEICTQITDGEHKTPNRVSEYQGYYLLSARNILNGKLVLDDVDYVSKEEYDVISKRCNPHKNDILISCSGSVGRCCIISDDNNYVMVRSVAMIHCLRMNNKFIMYAIQSPYIQTQIDGLKKQSVQANLFQSAIASLLILIPPIEEQHRIVERLDALLPVCEDLKEE